VGSSGRFAPSTNPDPDNCMSATPTSTVASRDFYIPQGATWSQPMVWKTGSPAAAVNLTGYTARMHVRKNIASPSPTVTLTTENGGITLGGALGTIELDIAASAATTIPAGFYVYDLELVTGANVRRLLQGKIYVERNVTR